MALEVHHANVVDNSALFHELPHPQVNLVRRENREDGQVPTAVAVSQDGSEWPT